MQKDPHDHNENDIDVSRLQHPNIVRWFCAPGISEANIQIISIQYTLKCHSVFNRGSGWHVDPSRKQDVSKEKRNI